MKKLTTRQAAIISTLIEESNEPLANIIMWAIAGLEASRDLSYEAGFSNRIESDDILIGHMQKAEHALDEILGELNDETVVEFAMHSGNIAEMKELITVFDNRINETAVLNNKLKEYVKELESFVVDTIE